MVSRSDSITMECLELLCPNNATDASSCRPNITIHYHDTTTSEVAIILMALEITFLPPLAIVISKFSIVSEILNSLIKSYKELFCGSVGKPNRSTLFFIQYTIYFDFIVVCSLLLSIIELLLLVITKQIPGFYEYVMEFFPAVDMD